MTSPNLTRTKIIHPNVYFLAITSFLTDVSSEMLANLLPLFLVSVLGTHRALVGLIDGVAETTASLVKIISGLLSDRLGKRKPLTIFGYSLSTLAKPFLYFASHWGWVLGVRFFDRLGKGIRAAPRDALIAGSVKSEQRGFAFGLHRAGDTAGAFTGLLIAMGIIWISQSGAQELSKSTFQWIILASIFPAVLAVLVLAIFVKETPFEDKNKDRFQSSFKLASSSVTWKQLDGRFRYFIGIMVIFTLGNSSDAFIILRAQERGLNVIQVMGMLLTFNAVYALLSGPAGSLSDHIGRRTLILCGWFVYAVCYIGFALANTGWMVWLWFAVYGLYYALTEGVAKALVADFIPPYQRGTAFGYYNAAIGFAALPASLVAGVLWQGAAGWGGLGPAAPFFAGATLAALAGILFFLGKLI
jgi:MFS family permease